MKTQRTPIKTAICLTLGLSLLTPSVLAAVSVTPPTEKPGATDTTGATASNVNSYPLGQNVYINLDGKRTHDATLPWDNRWATPDDTVLSFEDRDTLYVFRAVDNEITVSAYEEDTFRLISTKILAMPLPIFGGVYFGDDYNYVVYGQKNVMHDDAVVTFKTVKYSKSWEYLAAADYAKNNTEIPFDAGTVSMTEEDGYLYVHSAHKMYNGHQASITYSVDTKTMQIVDDSSEVSYLSYAYVSHSFGQFIDIDDDGDKLVALDHGDAYPRSVALTVTDNAVRNGRFMPQSDDEYWAGTYGAKTFDLLTIPGAVGANTTGVSVGGFEITDTHYIAAINALDFNKVTSFDNFNIFGTDVDERDVYLLLSEKANRDTEKVSRIRLTQYSGDDMTANTPYLVELENDRYMVLWETFEKDENNAFAYTGVNYVTFDGDGTDISATYHINASIGTQPVFEDGRVVWYDEGQFYQILCEDATDDTVIGGGSQKPTPEKPNPGRPDYDDDDDDWDDWDDDDDRFDWDDWDDWDDDDDRYDWDDWDDRDDDDWDDDRYHYGWRKWYTLYKQWINPFKDIFKNSPYYSAVRFVNQYNLFKGVSADEFAPELSMNRAMFVTVLSRLHGLSEEWQSYSHFRDVPKNAWYANAVTWAEDEKIVLGIDASNFGVDEVITIEQAAVMLARYADYMDIDTDSAYSLSRYSDDEKISGWAYDAMQWVVETGIYTGKDGYLKPKSEASRADVALMIERFATVYGIDLG